MTRKRLFGLRFYRQHPRLKAALYARCYGRVALWRRNLRARRRVGLRSWFAALFASVFARQIAHRYTVRPQLPDAPVLRQRNKGRRSRRQISYQRALRHVMTRARLQRFGVSVAESFTPDDRRRLRNARKAERHAV